MQITRIPIMSDSEFSDVLQAVSASPNYGQVEILKGCKIWVHGRDVVLIVCREWGRTTLFS